MTLADHKHLEGTDPLIEPSDVTESKALKDEVTY